MKKILLSAFIILSVMLTLPLAVIKKSSAALTAAPADTGSTDIPTAEKAVSEIFRICDTETGETTDIKAEDYIFGVLAAEMPALYETEALKAQAVAAYTFACRKKAENKDKSYDITNDHTIDQSFISEEKAVERWGERAEEYRKKLKEVIKQTENYMITYDGKPITAVYHAISSGKTESSENVWGTALPYLKSVASPEDKLSPDYISKLTVSEKELSDKLSDECDIKGDAENYFKAIKRTESGTVKTVAVCGSEIKGARIRDIFGLRSSNFEIEYSDGSFVFTVYGYGHGVGMSQYGANYMAKQGSDFKEILTHYYSDCKVEKI